MLNVLSLKPEAFGLDISDLSLKLVKLKKKGKYLNLASFGEGKINPGVIKEGEIKQEESFVQAIRDVLKKTKGEKLKTKYVIASLPEEKAFLQVIQMPKIPEEDLKSAVVFEAENYIPLPIEQVYLDFQVISPLYNHLDHLDVLIAAMPRQIIDDYLSCLKKAGLEPLALEIESQAISRALIKNETALSPALLIDLGQTRTSFIIFSGRSLRFTSSIPVSAQHLTELIAKTTGLGLDEAEKLKIQYGLGEKFEIGISDKKTTVKKGKGELFEMLVPAVVDLVQQIKKHSDYYLGHTAHEHLPPNGKTLKKILICGGGANLKGLPELLSLELKTPVEVGNPWVNILSGGEKETKELTFAKSLSYTTALGLALRGVNHAN